jgi:hypothetical protein
MSDQSLGRAFVEVGLKGLETTKAQLTSLKGQLDKVGKGDLAPVKGLGASIAGGLKSAASGIGSAIANAFPASAAGKILAPLGGAIEAVKGQLRRLGDGLNTIGNSAAKGFAVGTASIAGFLRLADPKGMEDLQVALASVGIQLGRIFVPLLREVTGWIQKLANYLKGLGDDQREQVLHWVKIGLAVTGVLMILPRLVGAFRLVGGAMTALGGTSLLATGGLGILLGLIAAALPAIASLFGGLNSEGGGGIFAPVTAALRGLIPIVSAVFQQIGQFATAVVSQLAPIFATVGAVVAQAFSAILPIVSQLVSTIGQIFQQIVPVVAQVLGVIGQILQAVVPIFATVFGAVLQVVSTVMSAVAQVIGPAMQVISSLIDTVAAVVLPLLDAVGRVVAQVVDSLLPIFNALIAAVVPVVQTLLGVFQLLIDALTPVIEAVTGLVGTIIDSLLPIFATLAEAVMSIIDAVTPVFEVLVEIVQEVIDALTPVVEIVTAVVTTIVEVLRPAFEILASVINAVVSVIGPLFQLLGTVLRPIISVISTVLRPILTLFGEILTFVGNMIIDVINAVISAVNSILEYIPGTSYIGGSRDYQLSRLGEGRQEDRRQERSSGTGGTEARGSNRPARNPDEFRGEVRQQAPQFVGIADLWRKLQTAQTEDAQSRIARETLAESRRGNSIAERIAENTRPGNAWNGAGGDW